MSIVLLLVGTLVILAAMLYLTLAVNEFEKKTLELGAILEERYKIPEPKKKGAGPAVPPPTTAAQAGGVAIKIPPTKS